MRVGRCFINTAEIEQGEGVERSRFGFRIDFVRKEWKSYLKSSNHNFHHYSDSVFQGRFFSGKNPASLFGPGASKGARASSYLQLTGPSRRSVLISILAIF
jgi:hypothetical protein